MNTLTKLTESKAFNAVRTLFERYQKELAASAIIAAILYLCNIHLEQPAITGGLTVGAILSGFASRNRNDMIVHPDQGEKASGKSIPRNEEDIKNALEAYFTAILIGLILAFTSLIMLICPPDLRAILIIVWLPIAVVTCMEFYRCERFAGNIIEQKLTGKSHGYIPGDKPDRSPRHNNNHESKE